MRICSSGVPDSENSSELSRLEPAESNDGRLASSEAGREAVSSSMKTRLSMETSSCVRGGVLA